MHLRAELRSPVTPTPSSQTGAEVNIIIISPRANDKVANPITVTGRARVFENVFQYRLKDSSDKIIYQGFAIANAQDIGLFGNFSVKIPIFINTTSNLKVEVYSLSAKDGSEINLVSIPVMLDLAAIEKIKIKTYFNSNKPNLQISCSKTYPIEREVIKTQETAFAALSELLRGVLPNEKSQGYSTSVPENVSINSITIKDGTARVDFNHNLESRVAGSCRVISIISQITDTLKQFPSIKNVIISINGRTENTLKPQGGHLLIYSYIC